MWTKLAGSTQEFAENIKAMVDAVEVDQVGIGADANLLSSHVGQGTNRAWPAQTGGLFYAVAGEMLLQGFTPDEIGKAGGGTFCRVFRKATAGHA